jgi:hypothetical protein
VFAAWLVMLTIVPDVLPAALPSFVLLLLAALPLVQHVLPILQWPPPLSDAVQLLPSVPLAQQAAGPLV